jgi:hypothetical protein
MIMKLAKPNKNTYVCKRASGCEEKPCDEAFKIVVMYVDQRTWDDPSKITDASTKEDWFARGSNHRIVNGCITRDLYPEEVWAVKIKTLKSLHVGRCVCKFGI